MKLKNGKGDIIKKYQIEERLNIIENKLDKIISYLIKE